MYYCFPLSSNSSSREVCSGLLTMPLISLIDHMLPSCSPDVASPAYSLGALSTETRCYRDAWVPFCTL